MNIKGFVFGLITGAGITVITKPEIREQIRSYFTSFDSNQVKSSVKTQFNRISEKFPIATDESSDRSMEDNVAFGSEMESESLKQPIGANTPKSGATGFGTGFGSTGDESPQGLDDSTISQQSSSSKISSNRSTRDARSRTTSSTPGTNTGIESSSSISDESKI